jgi:hypothetical protein
MTISTPTVAGQILTSAYVNDNINSGLVYVGTYSATSGTSLVCAAAFSSTYDNYRIVASGIRTTGDAGVSFQLGSTTTGYYAGYARVSSAGAFLGSFNSNTANWDGYAVSTAGQSGSFSVDMYSPFLTERTTFTGNGTDPRATANMPSGMSGYLNNSTSYTAFTILGGTFTNIVVQVYGYRKP